MNHTWGFKSDDHEWKSTRDLLYSLLRSVSNSCNYLLNVGPDALGDIPEEAVARLCEVGDWLRINGDAVYGASAVPFPMPCPWGMATGKGTRIYLIFEPWPAEGGFTLDAVLNRPIAARVLGSDAPLTVRRDGGAIHIAGLPAEAPSPFFSVVELTLEGDISIDPALRVDSRGVVTLRSGHAECDGIISIDPKGLPLDFRPGAGALRWSFEAPAGRYALEALSNRHWSLPWRQGIRVRFACDGVTGETELRKDRPLDNLQSDYHPETISELGVVVLTKDGMHTLSLEVTETRGSDMGLRTVAEDVEARRTLNLIHLALRRME